MRVQFDQWVFNSPVPIDRCVPVRCAALYAILVADDSSASFPFRPIYFGQTENLAQSHFFESHPRYADWVREAGSEQDLFVATYLCAGMTGQYREFVEGMLVREYAPACNSLATVW